MAFDHLAWVEQHLGASGQAGSEVVGTCPRCHKR